MQGAAKFNVICDFEFNVRQHNNGYIDAAARQNYWLRWLRMAGETQCETSLVGHLPIISAGDTRYPDNHCHHNVTTYMHFNL